MSHSARVLVVGHDEPAEARLSSRLKLCGCDCENIDPSRPHEASRARKRADVVVLNLLADMGRRPATEYLSFIRSLHQDSEAPLLPVLMLGGGNPDHTKLAIEAAARAEIDDVMLSPVSDLQIVERIRSLMRLNTMHDELVRRLATSSRYGVDAPKTVPSANVSVDGARVLVVGASESYGAVESALSGDGHVVGALSASAAFDYMANERFEIIIVDVPDDPQDALAFAQGCRANTRLYNTPIVFLAPPGVIPDTSPVFVSGITDLMVKPPRPEELKVRIQALVREVRFRESLRQVYKDARHMATSDALTGLYTRGFALEHMKGLIADAETRGHPFTVAYGRIENIHEINMLYGYAIGDRVIRQVGDVLGLLTRGEDLSVRYSGARFAILLPDTAVDASTRAINRILGVMNHTEFTIPELSEPVPVMMSMAATGYGEGDTPEGIVARAKALTKN